MQTSYTEKMTDLEEWNSCFQIRILLDLLILLRNSSKSKFPSISNAVQHEKMHTRILTNFIMTLADLSKFWSKLEKIENTIDESQEPIWTKSVNVCTRLS